MLILTPSHAVQLKNSRLAWKPPFAPTEGTTRAFSAGKERMAFLVWKLDENFFSISVCSCDYSLRLIKMMALIVSVVWDGDFYSRIFFLPLSRCLIYVINYFSLFLYIFNVLQTPHKYSMTSKQVEKAQTNMHEYLTTKLIGNVCNFQCLRKYCGIMWSSSPPWNGPILQSTMCPLLFHDLILFSFSRL